MPPKPFVCVGHWRVLCDEIMAVIQEGRLPLPKAPLEEIAVAIDERLAEFRTRLFELVRQRTWLPLAPAAEAFGLFYGRDGGRAAVRQWAVSAKQCQAMVVLPFWLGQVPTAGCHLRPQTLTRIGQRRLACGLARGGVYSAQRCMVPLYQSA
jgi:hypothetical protein